MKTQTKSCLFLLALLFPLAVSAQPYSIDWYKVSGGGGTSGYPTPKQALQSVLAGHEPWLSETGWKLTGRSAEAVAFASGDDSVDVVKNKAGKWNVRAVTACT